LDFWDREYLSPVDMRDLENESMVVLFILMCMGGGPFLIQAPMWYRRVAFQRIRKQIEMMIVAWAVQPAHSLLQLQMQRENTEEWQKSEELDFSALAPFSTSLTSPGPAPQFNSCPPICADNAWTAAQLPLQLRREDSTTDASLHAPIQARDGEPEDESAARCNKLQQTWDGGPLDAHVANCNALEHTRDEGPLDVHVDLLAATHTQPDVRPQS